MKIIGDKKAKKITEKYWTWITQTNMGNIGNIVIKRKDTMENIQDMKHRKVVKNLRDISNQKPQQILGIELLKEETTKIIGNIDMK